jgi:hypothetical protein
MNPDIVDRLARSREIARVNCETSRELCETVRRSLAESRELIRTGRTLLRRPVVPEPEGPQ